MTEHGLDLLIDAIPTADGEKDEIRKVIVGMLDELGADSELARGPAGARSGALLAPRVRTRRSDGQRQLFGSASSTVRPATRTPSSRTGRGGENARSSSSATRPTSSRG